MSDSKKITAKHDRLKAHMALLASHGEIPVMGERPDDEEIALLYENKLDFNRRQEVFSHINRDPELYRQWITLIESQELLLNDNQQSTPDTLSRLKQWFPTPWLPAAVATSVIALVLHFGLSAPYSSSNQIELVDIKMRGGPVNVLSIKLGAYKYFASQPREKQALLLSSLNLDVLKSPGKTRSADDEWISIGKQGMSLAFSCNTNNKDEFIFTEHLTALQLMSNKLPPDLVIHQYSDEDNQCREIFDWINELFKSET